jgi:penicillin-binding protein 1C
MWTHLQQRFWHPRRPIQVLLLVVGSLLVGRSLPYLAPIRSSDLVQDGQAIEFSDRNGLPLGTLLSRDREHTAVVPLSQISPHFLQAIIAAEDGRFYQHGALDLKAIARSLGEAIHTGRIASGASTITMQLARMLEPAPRTLPAKLKEIWLSWRITAGMNKSEILQAYINRLPMGSNIYGVEAASRVYFGIPAADLNLAQASLLAAIPNNPTHLNPYNAWQALKRRQRYVLDRLVQDGHITPEQAERAYQEALSLQSRQQGILAAPHFLFWLARQLPPDHPPRLQTTLDRPLQQFVEAQVREVVRSLAPHNVHQAAALVLDNPSGEVLAYVGSVNYFSEAQLGRNDGVQALRQPGSTLKPFLYQLALQKRLIRPSTVLADIPTHYAIPGAKLYSPSDYSETFYGPARIRIALANSLNVPAVRVLEKVGVPAFLDRLHQLGFQHLNHPPEYYGLGLTLGSGEVRLWELARAYRILAQQGQGTPEIDAGMGSVGRWGDGGMGRRGDAQRISQHPETWALIADILSDRYARAKAFGVDSILNLPFRAAVKTGTSSNFRDTWTVGFTRDYTVATWVGNFDGEPMQQVSGVMGAAPLWNRIMLHLHERQPPAPFSPPQGMVKRPICALSGLKPTPACPSVVQEYFYRQDLNDYESHPDTFYQQIVVPSEGGRGESDRPNPLARMQGSSQYRLNLPPEYNEWLSLQPSSNTPPTALRILFPRNGDIFLSEAAQREGQTLAFKVGGNGNRPLEWWLNGQKLATASSASFFWQLRPGQWTLEVRQGEMIDQVRFEVQLAERRSSRRGFAIAPNRR